MNLKFADTPKGWYQERACGILASLSLAVDANERMKGRSGALRWLYQHEMEYHFKRAVFDTLRLLQMLTHERGHTAFNNILDGNMDGFDLEKE